MATSIFEQWSQAGKFSLEPMLEFSQIAMRLCGDISKENMKAFNELMQNNTEQLQSLCQAKGLEDVMAIQSRWAAKTGPQFYQHAQHVLDRMLESASECSKLVEKGMHQYSKDAAKNFAEATKHASSGGKKGDH